MATLSTKLEYILVLIVVKEIIWVRNLLLELEIFLDPSINTYNILAILEFNLYKGYTTNQKPLRGTNQLPTSDLYFKDQRQLKREPLPIIEIYYNNQGIVKLAYNLEFYQRMKHINIIYYFLHNYIKNKEIEISCILIAEMTIDILTKALNQVKNEVHA
jgi:hypothetical protein